MIQAGDFRKGVTIEYEGNIYTIVDFQHVKPGKGAAFVRTRLKNVVTGSVLEKTFNPTEKVENAIKDIDAVNAQNLEHAKELISILNSRYDEFSDEAKAECDKLVKKVDKYYASVVDELITKVDADDEESIKRAQDAYNQLTDAQKAYVQNLPVLEQAIEDSQRGCRSGFVTILPLLCAAVLLILRKERK